LYDLVTLSAGSVTLDPDSAHSDLAISHERTRLTWKENIGNSDGLFSVLGLKGITSGRCHWEVEIENGNSSLWTLHQQRLVHRVPGEGV
jgi:butyrophilin